MFTLYKESNNKLEIIKDQESILEKVEKNMWIDVVNPSKAEIKKLADITGITYDFLATALDEEESAHLDIDEDDTLIVLDVPYMDEPEKENEKGFYATTPFVIVYNTDYLVTLCTKETALLQLVLAKNKKIEPHKHVRLTLQILYRLATIFITRLKKIDSQTKEVERRLRTSMKNKELFDLMELNKSLVFFSTALNANKIVLSKLTRQEEYKKYEDDYELMEDVTIENNQAIEMCSIYRDILAGMMDAFASVISNNLNIVMKALAVITIVLSIPTLVASIFGMNFGVIPLFDNPFGFWIIIGMSFVIAMLGAAMLYLYTKRIK